MNNITLKLATEKDIPVFIKLQDKIKDRKLYSFMDEEDVIEEFRKNVIYMIYRNDEVVGSIAYEIKNDKEIYISGFFIDPKYQKQGICSEALKQVLEINKNFEKFYLLAHPDNKGTLALCKKFNFIFYNFYYI